MASTVWRGNIAFGLVSIPVRLVRAARRERIQFRQVYESRPSSSEDDAGPEQADEVNVAESIAIAPVQRVHTLAEVREVDGKVPMPIASAEILKGFEIEPNRYVTLKPEEVKAVKPKTSTTIEITSFVKLEEIDPIYFDASYYVAPQPAGEKPYAILFGSLAHSKYTALGQMAMHGREHAVVIRTGATGLILETLFYQNEVHLEDQFVAEPSLAVSNELKMAEAFIRAMTVEFNPGELVDQYEKRIKALIDSRTSASVSSAPDKLPTVAPVVDIMDALRKSLDQVRKPVAKESRSKRTRVS